MNITLLVYCKSDRSLQLVEHIPGSVVGYWQELGLAADMNSIAAYTSGRCRIFNTNLLAPEWQVQPSFECDGTVVSMSAIAVPFDQEITQSSFEDDLVLRVRSPDRLVGLLPPFFGCFSSRDRCGVFTDYLGVGRAYSLENADFFVASNHIGSCLFFERNAPEDDFRAWQLFSGLGWFIEDDSPFKQVKRLRPSTLITFNKEGLKDVTEYFDYKSLYSGQGSPVSPAEIAAQMRTAAQNVGQLNHGKVIVDLSGGRDSRVATAAFISSATPCVVQTVGTISEEADVARRLMVGLPTEHRIVPGNSASTRGTIQERIARAMAFWDGDMAPAGTVARRGKVKIGGGGGEIAHGNFYGTAELLDSVRASRRATDRLSKAYSTAPGVTPEARTLIKERFEAINDELLRAGMREASVLDGFYLTERFRRWVAAGHHTNSILLFAVKSFVAAALHMTPEERQKGSLHIQLCESLIPGWGEIPFFKAKPGTRDQKAERGLRIWQGANANEFLALLIEARRDPLWDGEAVLEQAVRMLRGQSENRMEALFQRVLWRHEFVAHHSRLSRTIEQCWSGILPSYTQSSPSVGQLIEGRRVGDVYGDLRRLWN